MKSVGEAMSIGRSFTESLQKGLRSIETGLTGLNEPNSISRFDKNNTLEENQLAIKERLKVLASDRILCIAQAFRYQISLEEIQEITKYDPWFLNQIEFIVKEEENIKKDGLPKNKEQFLYYKRLGFSDARLGELSSFKEEESLNERLFDRSSKGGQLFN